MLLVAHDARAAPDEVGLDSGGGEREKYFGLAEGVFVAVEEEQDLKRVTQTSRVTSRESRNAQHGGNL